MKVTETKIEVSDLVENCICPFVRSQNRKNSALMNGKGISVPCSLQMASTPSTPLRIWKVTTSFLGARTGIPRMTTCRCCARNAMRRSRIDKADRGDMMEYRYFMYGMFDGTDGDRYDICIPLPFV